MSIIQLRDVRKNYGALEVLHGVSHEIRGPEFVVILGPSGCGKSTLLRMIAGLETVTGGEIAVDGVRVNELPPHKRDMAMVFQNYALYPHLTVFDNLAYGLRIRRQPRTEIRTRVAEIASMLQIEHLLARRPAQLSGGQRQRVAMGRAVVRRPKAFLFDEPLSNLDAKLRNEMRVEIRKLHDALGATSVFVTHDQTEAMTMADRIVVMNAGRVVQSGRPIDIYNHPTNLFVATFVGSPAMNLYRGKVDASGNSVIIGGSKVPLPHALDPGRQVDVGIRAEHFDLAGSGDCSFPFHIGFVESLGSETYLHGEVAGLNTTVRVPLQVNYAKGDQVTITAQSTDARFFDADGGNTLFPPRAS